MPLTGADEYEAETFFHDVGMAIRVLNPGWPAHPHHWDPGRRFSSSPRGASPGGPRCPDHRVFVGFSCTPRPAPIAPSSPLGPVGVFSLCCPPPVAVPEGRAVGLPAPMRPPPATTRARPRRRRTTRSRTRDSRRWNSRATATACFRTASSASPPSRARSCGPASIVTIGFTPSPLAARRRRPRRGPRRPRSRRRVADGVLGRRAHAGRSHQVERAQRHLAGAPSAPVGGLQQRRPASVGPRLVRHPPRVRRVDPPRAARLQDLRRPVQPAPHHVAVEVGQATIAASAARRADHHLAPVPRALQRARSRPCTSATASARRTRATPATARRSPGCSGASPRART